MPLEKNILFGVQNIPETLLHLIGFVKIKNIGLEISFLEKIFKDIFKRKRKVFYFDFYFLNKYNISQIILEDILVFLKLVKVAGTSNISYWFKKREIYSKSTYDKDNPFYILKKLQ